MSEQGFGHGFGMLVRGLAVGAVAMYFMDPDKGRRRRAIARDKLRRFGNDASRLTQQASRDLSNRLHGMNAALEHRTRPRGDVDELKLIERARSALGRCVAHPHAVQVGAHGTTVVLSGPVLAHEVPGLLMAVHAVHGVTDVENHLNVHASDDGIPSLQGQGRRRGMRGSLDTPGMRLAMLAGGGLLALYGVAKRGAGGMALMSAGLGMAVRSVDQDAALAIADAARGAMAQGRRHAGLGDAMTRGDDRREMSGRGMQDIGADGTPMGQPGAGQRTAASPLDLPTEGAPLVGNDGTRSTTSADPRTSAGRDQGGFSVPDDGPNTRGANPSPV